MNPDTSQIIKITYATNLDIMTAWEFPWTVEVTHEDGSIETATRRTYANEDAILAAGFYFFGSKPGKAMGTREYVWVAMDTKTARRGRKTARQVAEEEALPERYKNF